MWAWLGDAATHAREHKAFDPVAIDVPAIDVNTNSGYHPDLEQIVAFVNGESRL